SLHEANAARAGAGVYDDGVRASFAALARLKPARFGKVEVHDDAPPPGPVADAIALAGASRWSEASQLLRQALADPAAPAIVHSELGIVLRNTGEFRDAETAYRAALATDPSYTPAYRNLGVLLDLYLQDPAGALEQFERHQALLPAPDPLVAAWITELRNRTRAARPAATETSP
nr:tetratricopeptide repeat protein [Steroidobacteraceae bacterium]